MKRILYIILLGCMLITTACDSYLDIKPVGSVIPGSLAEYRALLTRSYKDVSLLRDRGMASFRSDEMFVRNKDFDLDSYADIERWNDQAPHSSTASFEWAVYYNVLFIANHIIENEGGINEGSAEDIRQLVGEAYMMRAYMHFLLVNLYGQPYTKPGALETKSIPLKLDTDLEKVLTRQTVAEVYSSIDSDIAKAKEMITQEKWEPRYRYRFTTASVDALQSRVALYKGDWETSLKASKAVIEGEAALVDLKAADAMLPNNFQSPENLTALEMCLSSSINNAGLVTPSFLKLYGEGDLRINQYFSAPDENGFRKSQKAGSNTYLCSFRLGEIYLNAAEAAAQLNQLEEARRYLFKLMENRYTADAFTVKKVAVEALAQSDLITEILNERARELSFEGHRWFDLRRTTRPRLEKTVRGEQYVLEADDPRYTLLIPKEALEANPGLYN